MVICIQTDQGEVIKEIENPTMEQLILYSSLVHKKTRIITGSIKTNDDKEYWVNAIDYCVDDDFFSIIVVKP